MLVDVVVDQAVVVTKLVVLKGITTCSGGR